MMKKNMVLKSVLLVASAALIVGCGQNPFPEKKLTQGQVDQPEYTLEAPVAVECVSEQLCEFDVKASVLAEMGYPEVRMADLPAGAKFLSRTGTFSWTPKLMDREGERTRTVFVLLASSNQPTDFGMARAVTIHVTAAGHTMGAQ